MDTGPRGRDKQEMKRYRLLSVLIVVLALSMVLPVAGCKKEPPPPKEITISYYVPVVSLDPPLCSRAPDYEWIMNVFNGLVRYKPGSTEVEADLAERWEVSPDGLEYTFYLREGVQFHRGYGEVTAKDVKYTFERVQDPELGSAYRSDFEYIKSMDIINDYTIKLTLKSVYSDFLPAVLAFRGGYIVCEQAIKDLGDEWALKPIGTGAYMVESYVPNEEHVFVANPDYFRGKPKIDKAIFKCIPDENVQVMAMVNGEVDYAMIREPEPFNLLKEQGLNYTATPVFGRFAATVNILRPGVDDKRVRQALAYALDRQEFLDKIWSGMGEIEGIWSVIPPGMLGHTDDVQKYEYDEQKAKDLLAEAGHPNGQGLPTFYSLGRPAYTPIAETLQGYWSRIGVNLQADPQDGAALTAKWKAGDFDFYMSGPTRAAVDQLLLSISSKQIPGCYTAYDALIEAQRAEPDQAKRIEILEEIQRQVAEDCVHIPIYRAHYVTAFRDGVTGDIPNTFFWLFMLEMMDITE
ncbi:MAG: ABC transporter substrate-binding protein [Bacillota bacterium]|nr:MAG: ABC transporter substrate-binding protein [Bacillota bacterium]